VHRVPIDVPALTFMHDFAITQRHVVFYVLPVLFGDLRSAVPLCWDPSFPARVGILPRDGFQDDMRWFDVAPCTISHTVNAFEDGASVVLDAVRAPRPLVAHTLHRFTFDLDRGSARESTLDPRFLDFPRVHPHYVGARHRFVYSTELCDFGRDGSFSKTRAHRHDLQLQRSLVHEFGEDWMPGEAVVIPRADRRDEQAAWIMLFVHARDGSQTELVVLDAEHFSAPPLARVRIPGRVPYGLHGAWLADDE
jgi:carotenoid cleavage dioxygenase